MNWVPAPFHSPGGPARSAALRSAPGWACWGSLRRQWPALPLAIPGAVLYADFAGNLDSCIVIRTLLMKGKKAYLQAGAGIVADSDPQREFEESENKSRAVLRAVEMARGSV